MSGTTPTPPKPAGSDAVTATWGPVSVSILAEVIFFAAIGVAWWTKDPSLPLLLGAASANATTVVSYWLGSSSGSKGKDATIAQISSAATAPPPPGTTTTTTTGTTLS